MMQEYEIQYGGTGVGTVRVEKQGLYICFSCRCRLPQEGLYRIHAVFAQHREDLGICVPMGSAFGMDKKIPAKRLRDGDVSFELVPMDWAGPEEPETPPEEESAAPETGHEAPAEDARDNGGQLKAEFIAVSEEEPFEHLDKLENAHMEIRGHVTGVVITHETEQ